MNFDKQSPCSNFVTVHMLSNIIIKIPTTTTNWTFYLALLMRMLQPSADERQRDSLSLNFDQVFVDLLFAHLSLEGINDELEVKRIDALDALLDDVVAVLVLDALEHVALQFGDDELKEDAKRRN